MFLHAAVHYDCMLHEVPTCLMKEMLDLSAATSCVYASLRCHEMLKHLLQRNGINIHYGTNYGVKCRVQNKNVHDKMQSNSSTM